MDPVTRARTNALLLQTLAELLLREVRDPRVQRVTLTGVEVTPDLSFAKVFYSLLGSEQDRDQARAGLQKAAGFLRREVGRRLTLRTSPELRFHFDASLEQGQRIESLLRELQDGPAVPDAGGDDDA